MKKIEHMHPKSHEYAWNYIPSIIKKIIEIIDKINEIIDFINRK